ncbi:MAG: hydrolase 1, exosortase A system-associated [Halofilum sp. (in: g-proteobacteria)]|nr:hydrolase 1, exosortase A system-associated [Halofilum sp. (in: g-proteobacteria)]
MSTETAFSFECHGEQLPGILHVGDPGSTRGVLVIVGGPQYRAGSHRQFVLLARGLAARGIPVMRFDFRGMGDAGGDWRDFTAIDEDIRAAMDAFQARQPGLREIVLWGLCDAASAALFYGWRDARVAGMVLLNPWVRTEAGEARAYLRHYYVRRLASRAFWRKLLGGGLDWLASLRGLAGRLARARAGDGNGSPQDGADDGRSLPERMADGLERFRGPVLCVLSGNDLTAAEFRDTVAASARWRGLMEDDRVRRVELAAADHTFSRRAWRDEVTRHTGEWVEAL